MAKDYNHKEIEPKWQKFWEEEGVYKTQENGGKPKQYILDMFPYPSGAGLHVGHPRGYIGSDVLSRMRRMQGFNVLHPMGFDAFGLPAEQYAIQTGEHPSVITEKAIETYKKQLSLIGLSYDWSREVETIDPEYYKWTQWIFLKLYDSYFDEKEGKAKPISELIARFEKEDSSWKAKSEKEKEDLLMNYRLAYEGYSEVNWCPELGTVLANDEIVDGPDGKPVSERGGFPVEKKNMRQWFLRITAYADRLLSGLENINWPEHIKEIQKNWIGKSEGAEIEFAFANKKEIKSFGEEYQDSEKRDFVKIILRNKEGKILGLKIKSEFGFDLPGGAIDDGESPEQAAERELKEETEYTNFKFIQKISTNFVNYYHVNKQQYFHGNMHAFLYELQDEEKSEKNLQDDETESEDGWFDPKDLWGMFPEKSSYHTALRQSIKDYLDLDQEKIKVFTTRPETIFGATFIAVSAGYADEWLKNDWNPSDEIKNYISKTLKENENSDFKEKEKTGIYADFEVVNPATGENIPVWITNYVLDGVGTGAIMAVPAHDERDFEFAKKFGLKIKNVVFPHHGEKFSAERRRDVVKGVILKEDQVYLVKEDTETHGQSPWALPGGAYEEGETDEEAVEREVREETGFTDFSISHSVLGSQEYYVSAQNGPTVRCSKGYLINLKSEDKVNAELEGKWFSIKEAKEVMLTANYFSDSDILEAAISTKLFTGEGVLVDSGKFSLLSSQEAKSKITEFVGGKMVTKYKMRDAIFARQRYWGEPIPLKHVGDLIKPLSENQLPLRLPNVDSYKPTGNGESPLAGVKEWKDAGFETNTMPGWAGSSWYFLRYMDPKNTEAFAGKDAVNYWQDVDVYVGGAEHATGHLLYSRFWHKVLKDLGYVGAEEPFKLLKNQGLILASDGRKMSKRWGNVVNPDEMVDRFGADSFRLYEMFIGPFEQYTSWNTDGLVGTRRFLERVWRAKERIGEENKEVDILVNKTIKKITDDIENFRFNTSVSSMMILVNKMEEASSFSKENYVDFLKILAPFAPHMTEELWHELGEVRALKDTARTDFAKSSIHKSEWPKADESKLKDEKVKIAVQVNGKVRDEIEIAPDASEEDVKEIALARPAIQDFIGSEKIKKFIYVKGKIVNIVI